MYPSTNQPKPITPWLGLITVALLALVTIFVIRDSIIRSTTGKLNISSSDSHTLIAISANNTQAAVAGIGQVNTRLKAGIYLITGNYAGKSAQATITIKTHETKNLTLNLNAPPATPTPDNITFAGLDSLKDNGLTATQVGNLKGLFFQYKSTSKQIVISNVEPGPHDANSSDPTLSLTFSGTIDGKNYTAVVSYTDFDNVTLVLTDPTSGTQLFSGSSVQSAPDS